MAGAEIDQLIARLAKLPGLGPRSARRATLALLKRREVLMRPLVEALRAAAENIASCGECGNLDTVAPCSVCRDEARDPSRDMNYRPSSEIDGVSSEEATSPGAPMPV